MPLTKHHRDWKIASRRADDAANAIEEMRQSRKPVSQQMQAELKRLEEEAVGSFEAMTKKQALRRPKHA